MFIKIGDEWYNPDCIESITTPYYLVKTDYGHDMDRRGDKWNTWIMFRGHEAPKSIVFKDRREAECAFNMITGLGCVNTTKLFDEKVKQTATMNPLGEELY